MKKLVDKLNKLEEIIASSLLIVTSLIVFLQVVLRYGFNFSFPWTEEVARYMIVWFVFLGASIGVRENSHPAMDTLLCTLPPLVKSIAQIAITLTCITFAAIIIWSGTNVVISAYNLGSTSTALQVPLFIPYIAVPLGLGLMLIRYLFQLKGQISALLWGVKIKEGNV